MYNHLCLCERGERNTYSIITIITIIFGKCGYPGVDLQPVAYTCDDRRSLHVKNDYVLK